MSELLVCAVDQPGALRYKQGDIVAVFPDGHTWGAREGLPTFWQISVVSIVESDRTSFLEEDRIQDPLITDPSLWRLRRRRKRFIDITQLSNLTQSRLANTGKATVLRAALLGALTLRTTIGLAVGSLEPTLRERLAQEFGNTDPRFSE